MRISDRVYLYASGALGTSLSHPLDCNAYAIDCGGEFMLVDCGVGRYTDVLIENLIQDGIELHLVRHLFVTHGHLDHSGGAAVIKEELGSEVYASSLCAGFLETGDEEGISLPQAKRAGIYGETFHLRSVKVDCVLNDGDTTRIGNAVVEAIATPGHSCDMLSCLVTLEGTSYLFPGDTVFEGGKILLSAVYDCDLQQYVASLRKLRKLRKLGLFPGHGKWSPKSGHTHIEKANQDLDRLLLPPNLL